ncbi:MAG: O-antigen ligase family protein [Lentimicrobiaceae bacterium]|nr:O-antigen ligase family protein [Lentimicrobiaceae bacterium]
MNEILYKIIFHVLPYFFVGRLLNYDRINKIAIIFGYISIIIFLFIRFVLHTNDDFNYVGGDMGGAYLILPSIILITLNAYETKKIIHISVAICGIIFLFMLGNRGSILYEITFIVLILLKNIKNTNAISKIFIVMLLVFLISQFDVIISRFEHIIEQYGFSTRIVDFLSDDNITDDSGRLYLWNNIFDSLKYNFWGLGITGDRVLLNGMYAHNVFIEILSSFGFFIGTIINVLLIYVLIKAYRCVRNTNESNFYIAMICFGLLPLLTSMSFIEYHYFFILVGYSIGIIKRYCGIRNRKYTILINN